MPEHQEIEWKESWRDGNVLIPPEYEEVKYTGDGVFECQLRKGDGCISFERLKEKRKKG